MQSCGNVERLSKKLSLLATVSPDILTNIAELMQYNRDEFYHDILALEDHTEWQFNNEEAEKWHEKGREYFNQHAHQQAFLCFCKGAENGNAEDMYIIGCCFSEGRGVRQSDEEALRWYKKSANYGNPDAMYSLALCYEQGIGIERNMEKAKIWFEKAAKSGYSPSGSASYFDQIQKVYEDKAIKIENSFSGNGSSDEDQEEDFTGSKPEFGPMEKKASKMLEAMGVHISDEDISKLNESIKENKSFPEMVRDFSSMVYKDNPAMKSIFDSVSDDTIASWKDMLENIFKGGPKS